MNRTRKTFLIFFLLLSIIGLGVIIWGNYQIFQQVNQVEGEQIEKLWTSGELNAIINLARGRLQTDSLNFQLLRYSGYAYFYLALSQIDEGERKLDLQQTILQLRKALVAGFPNEAVQGEINYVLGKAYYYNGFPTIPLAVRFLQRSIEQGYTADDSYEFLAEAFQQLDQEEKSLVFFEKFDISNASDRFLLAYGKSLIGAGRNSTAEEILQRALKNTQNQLLISEILLQTAQVYYNEAKWEEAQAFLKQVLEKQESADAHFLLGEVYHALNQPAQARREWRLTLQLDDQYRAAYRRLQE